MNHGSGSGVATELEQVREMLAGWRATPGKGQRIPDAVWRKAVRAAKRHGLNPVSKALGLDYNCLKKHTAESGRNRKKEVALAPAFVEVQPVHRRNISPALSKWKRAAGCGCGSA